MKTIFTRYSVMLLLFIAGNILKSNAQILTYTNATNGSLYSVAANATGTSLLRVNNAQTSSSSCSTGFSSSNFSTSINYSTSLSAVEVSVSPDLGYTLNITGFSTDYSRSSSGPGLIRFAYSTDGGNTWISESSDHSTRTSQCGKNYSLSWATSFSVVSPGKLIFRVYGFAANKSSGREQLSNLKINGAVVLSPCSVPAGLSATSITSSSATLSWNDVSNATGYNIRYRISGTSAWTNTTSSTSTLNISGLNSSTTYECQVQTACIGGTTSSFSSSATFTTTALPCSVPTGLTATSITSSSATLDWNSVSGATSYNIRYRVSGTTTWTNTTSSTSSLNISGLTVSTTYAFQVQTVCSGGTTSSFSSSATFTTTASTSCSVPTGLTAINITSTSATLDWNDVSGATSYNIRYRVSGTTTWTNTTSSTSSLNISGLTVSTTYAFQVQTVCSGGTTSSFTSSATFTTSSSTTAIPKPDHIVVVILENHGYPQIIGSSAAPYINSLAKDANSALFTQSFAIEHPSQPNYLDFYSGSNQGVTNDNMPTNIPFTTPNLGRQLIDKSLSYATYSESLPSVGYNGATSGSYARKHNPAANWMGTGKNQIPATTNQPFSAFPTDFTQLPTVCYVIPNENDDMHNGTDPTTVTTGDTWIKNHLDGYVQWSKTHNSLFILTFDEDNDNFGNHIVTIFTGSMVAAGQYSNHVDHYSVLRTIEDMYGLPYAANASKATTITQCWTSAFATSTANTSLVNANKIDDKLSVFPNPATESINFKLNKLPASSILLRIFDMTGRLQGQYQFVSTQTLKINTAHLAAGNYYYNLIQNNKVMYSGKFTVAGK